MKEKLILVLIIVGLLLTSRWPVAAQTATPTISATASGTLTPTKTTQLPKTGILKYSLIFFAIPFGIILFSLVF